MKARLGFGGVRKSKSETLRLRAGTRTFSAFVDVREAFDIAWRDAVLVLRELPARLGAFWMTFSAPRPQRSWSMGICPSHGPRVWLSAKAA